MTMPPSAVLPDTPPSEMVDESTTTENGSLIYNPKNAPWIVQKYGGTSIGKFAEDIASKIVKPRVGANRIALVCSARSTGTKAEGTTSRLLRAATVALETPIGDVHSSGITYTNIVTAILDDHVKVGRENFRSPKLLDKYITAVSVECTRLTSLLSAAQTLSEISPKTRDAIIGTGEKLSCIFITALLNDRGVAAEYVNLETVIPNGSDSQDLDQGFYDSAATAIAQRVLSKCGNRIPVVTGFFGTVPGSLLSAVGRGYTDLCAALLAVGTHAEELQVWKEVDGIFTADPRKVPQAQLIPVITPEETAELTYWGSEVIHPFTMDQVIRAHIPIRIKNTKNPHGSGTVIFPETASRPASPGLGVNSVLKPRIKRPTAVTTKSDITVLNVCSNRKSLSHGFLAGIFSTLDARRLNVDLISTSEVHVSMAIHTPATSTSIADSLDAVIGELGKYGNVEVIRGLAILAVVGAHMRQMVGVAGDVFTTLAGAGINIEMISQGSSEINISCVVKEEESLKAMTVLHTRLFLYSE